eukprot:scaffold681_cov25-Cyclotella_meneghiniana.AAC.4
MVFPLINILLLKQLMVIPVPIAIKYVIKEMKQELGWRVNIDPDIWYIEIQLLDEVGNKVGWYNTGERKIAIGDSPLKIYMPSPDSTKKWEFTLEDRYYQHFCHAYCPITAISDFTDVDVYDRENKVDWFGFETIAYQEPGSSKVFHNNAITVIGSGHDIWGNSDRFHYLYASTSQVASIEMYVKSFTGVNMQEWAKGGLMIRKYLSPQSPYFSVLVTGSNKLQVQWRDSDKGTTHKVEAAIVQKSNIWLKITKSGNSFEAYYKINANDSWTEIGSKKTINFGSDPFSYGIAVTSSDVAKEAKLEASRWSSVGVSGGVMTTNYLSSKNITLHNNDVSALEEEISNASILLNKKYDSHGLEHLDELQDENVLPPVKDNPHGQEHLDVVHNENVLPRLLTVNERGTLETDNIRPSLSASSSSSSNLSEQEAVSYKVTIQEYDGGFSQLFKYHKVTDSVFNIVSAKHPTLYLTLSECAANADILLVPKTSGKQHLNWIIKGSSIVNSCTSNGIKEGSLSIDMTGATPEATIQANLKSDEGGQKWIARSNDVVLSQVGYKEKSGKNANQTWIPRFVDTGYSLGLHPGFPGGTTCLSSIKDLRLGCLSSTEDRYLAKEHHGD